MASDTIQFVDSIASSPTVRLNLNDETTWRVRSFVAPPPRLRRTMTQNAMTDGGFVSTSQYGPRTLFIDLDLVSTTQDLNAAQLQLLARELDRETNFIKYQPVGATSPVFFKTWRSDFSALVDMKAALAFRQLSLEVVAEPFARGLMETVSVGTVGNDPGDEYTTGPSPNCRFDVSGVKGDVPADFTLTDTYSRGTGDVTWIAQRCEASFTGWANYYPAETAGSYGTDTTLIAGPDAAMSGNGVGGSTGNFTRTAFTSTAVAARVNGTLPAIQATRGTYRVFAVVRRSDATSVIQVGMSATDLTTLPLTTSRIRVDLGLYGFGSGTELNTLPSPLAGNTFSVFAGRASGTGNLDWDYIEFQPADTATLVWSSPGAGQYAGFDGAVDLAFGYSTSGSITAGTAYVYPASASLGGFPQLRPGLVNRFFMARTTSAGVISKTTSGTVTLYYNPCYLHVRPATT